MTMRSSVSENRALGLATPSSKLDGLSEYFLTLTSTVKPPRSYVRLLLGMRGVLKKSFVRHFLVLGWPTFCRYLDCTSVWWQLLRMAYGGGCWVGVVTYS